MSLGFANFGRATEARFLVDAQQKGLMVSFPFSGAPGYDAIVDTGSQLFRVQIKGCNTDMRRNECCININRYGRRPPKYDILAVWVQVDDEGRWYFFGPKTRFLKMLRVVPNTNRIGWDIFRTLDPIQSRKKTF